MMFFLINYREFIIRISSVWKFIIGILARKVWKKTLHDCREHTQHHWMDITIFYTLHDFTLCVNHNDGFKRRIQRSSYTVIRWRNNGTQAQGINGFVVVYVIHVRSVHNFHVGLSFQMENCRVIEYMLPCYLHMSPTIGMLPYSISRFDIDYIAFICLDSRVSSVVGK